MSSFHTRLLLLPPHLTSPAAAVSPKTMVVIIGRRNIMNFRESPNGFDESFQAINIRMIFQPAGRSGYRIIALIEPLYNYRCLLDVDA